MIKYKQQQQRSITRMSPLPGLVYGTLGFSDVFGLVGMNCFSVAAEIKIKTRNAPNNKSNILKTNKQTKKPYHETKQKTPLFIQCIMNIIENSKYKAENLSAWISAKKRKERKEPLIQADFPVIKYVFVTLCVSVKNMVISPYSRVIGRKHTMVAYFFHV